MWADCVFGEAEGIKDAQMVVWFAVIRGGSHFALLARGRKIRGTKLPHFWDGRLTLEVLEIPEPAHGNLDQRLRKLSVAWRKRTI